VNSINDAINRGESLQSIVQLIADGTKDAFDTFGATFLPLSADGKRLTLQNLVISSEMVNQIEKMIGHKVPPIELSMETDHVYSRALRERKAILSNSESEMAGIIGSFLEVAPIPETIRAKVRKAIPLLIKMMDYRSQVTIPLISGDELLGTLSLGSRRHLNEDDLHRLENIAGQLTTALKRKQTEEALRASESEMRALFQAIPDVILVLDKDGRYVKVAPTSASNLLYLPEQNLIGKRLHEIFSRQKADEFLGHIHQALKTQKPVQFEYALLIEDHIAWFSGAAAPLTQDTVIWVARDITTQKQAEEQVQRRLADLEVLYEGGLSLSSSLEPHVIGEKIITVLSKRLNWHHAAVRVRRADSDEVELLAFSESENLIGRGDDNVQTVERAITHVGVGLSGWVIKHGRTINSGDLENDPRYHETFPGMRSGLYVPIWSGGRTLGCISVESSQREAFNEDDERLLTTLASQAAAALENARLFQDAVRSADRRAALHAAGREMSQISQDLEQVYASIHRAATRLMPTEAFIITLADEERQEIEGVYLFDRGGRSSAVRIPFGQGLSSRVITTGESILVNDDLEKQVDGIHFGSPDAVRSIVA